VEIGGVFAFMGSNWHKKKKEVVSEEVYHSESILETFIQDCSYCYHHRH
jgi:hypothetical protein